MQRSKLSSQVIEQLLPGRHHKRDFKPKLSHGFIKGNQGSTYDVLDIIGEGGTSKVKLLENRESHSKRVLKIIYPHDLLTDEKAQEYYEKEFRILNKLHRIDPVRITTTSKAGIHKYQIVMDLAEGHELWELIHEKPHLLPRDPDKLLQIGLNILLDLFIIHQAGILLIDDKTENIIVDPKTLKITRIDFGFAEDGYDFEKDQGYRTGFRGTPAISAPEALKAGYYDGKVTFNKATDIYSAGAALRELLMGQDFTIPFSALVISQNRPSSMVSYPKINALLIQMTSPNPKERPSLVQVIEAFEEALKLKKGSSIDKLLKEKNQPSETKLNCPSDDRMVANLTPNENIPRESSENKKQVSEHKLTDEQITQAWKMYKKEKNSFFGMPWYFTSDSTFDTIMTLKNNKKHFLDKEEKTNERDVYFENGQYYFYEKDQTPKAANYEELQYQKAKTFISNNPHTTFAEKLAHVMQDEELIQQTRDARRWFG